MINIALVRGKYLNNFEGQNFIFKSKRIALKGISSFFPIHCQFPFPVIKLPSFADLGFNRFSGQAIKYILNRILGDSQILFGLENYCKSFDIFDTADPHYYYSYQLAKLKEKKMIKKLIVTYCETIPFNNEGTRMKKFIKYFTLRQADFFVVHTYKSKKALIKEGVSEKLIKIIKLGVDLERFKPKLIKKNKSKNNEFKILFIGRMVEEKGVFDIIDVFKQIIKNEKKNKIELIMVGEGEVKDKLIKICKKEKILNNFVFFLKSSYEYIDKIYQNADLLVVPSKSKKTWEEQYGMVLVEGMACGLPIIAYKSGAIPEVLDNAGILVKEGKKELLFTAIVNLISNVYLQKKLKSLARDRAVKYYDAKKTAKNFEEFYYKILNKNKHGN